MRKAFGVSAMLLAMAPFAFAVTGAPVPEIDANSAGTALTLLTGALVVFRARRR